MKELGENGRREGSRGALEGALYPSYLLTVSRGPFRARTTRDRLRGPVRFELLPTFSVAIIGVCFMEHAQVV